MDLMHSAGLMLTISLATAAWGCSGNERAAQVGAVDTGDEEADAQDRDVDVDVLDSGAGDVEPVAARVEPLPFLWGIGEPVAWNTIGRGNFWDLDAQLDALLPLRPQLFRLWFWADHVLSSPTELRPEKLAVYDAAVARLVAAGVTIVGMDDAVPGWLSDVPDAAYDIVPCRDLTPGSPYLGFLENYATAWRTKAAHFDAIRHWEIGNEPNLNTRLEPSWFCDLDGKFTPEERQLVLFDMMYYAKRGIVAGNPNAFVFMPGLAPSGGPEYLEAMYQAIESGVGPSTDPRDYFDGAAWHPYLSPTADGTRQAMGTFLTVMHGVLAAHGDADLPVLLSELGVPDGGGSDATSEAAAQSLVGAAEWARENLPSTWGVTVFRGFDDHHFPLGDPARGFGLLTPPPDYAWKPTAYAFYIYAANTSPARIDHAVEFIGPADTGGFTMPRGGYPRNVGGWLVVPLSPSFETVLESPPFAIAASPGQHLELVVAGAPTSFRLAFTTAADPAWDDAKSYDVTVPANGDVPRRLVIALDERPAWAGEITAVRFTFPATAGDVKLDSIRVLPPASEPP